MSGYSIWLFLDSGPIYGGVEKFKRNVSILKQLLLIAGISTSVLVGANEITLPEGTPVYLEFRDNLSSKSAIEGQRFNLRVEDAVVVDGQVLIPRDSTAVGTVAAAQKRRMLGRQGELNLILSYAIVNGQRIPLRGSKSQEGKRKVGAAAALTVAFGGLGLLKRGKDVEIPAGTPITGYVDVSTVVTISGP